MHSLYKSLVFTLFVSSRRISYAFKYWNEYVFDSNFNCNGCNLEYIDTQTDILGELEYLVHNLVVRDNEAIRVRCAI